MSQVQTVTGPMGVRPAWVPLCRTNAVRQSRLREWSYMDIVRDGRIRTICERASRLAAEVGSYVGGGSHPEMSRASCCARFRSGPACGCLRIPGLYARRATLFRSPFGRRTGRPCSPSELTEGGDSGIRPGLILLSERSELTEHEQTVYPWRRLLWRCQEGDQRASDGPHQARRRVDPPERWWTMVRRSQ